MKSATFKAVLEQARSLLDEVQKTDELRGRLQVCESQLSSAKREKAEAVANLNSIKQYYVQELATQRTKGQEISQRMTELQRRAGTEEMMTQKEQEWRRIQDELASQKQLHSQMQKSLNTQIELCKKEKARVSELESRLSDVNKKYDDSKKAYFKSKEERERLRQELDRFKSDGAKEHEVPDNKEVTHKYEQIKIKYRQIEDTKNTAEKRVTQLESDNRGQSDQLEELYQQVDCLQEINSNLEQERATQQAQFHQVQTQMMEHQRLRLESDVKFQQLTREKEQMQAQLHEKTFEHSNLKELISQLEQQAETNGQLCDNLRAQHEQVQLEHAKTAGELTQLKQESQLLQEKFDKAFSTNQINQKQLAQLKAQSAEQRIQLENGRGKNINHSASAVPIMVGEVADAEYKVMKYEDWRPKMICMTCKQHENDIILTCGHLSCSKCIEESFSSRQRVCPVDRRRIAKTDIIKIFWNENE